MARIINTATLDRAASEGNDREWVYNGLDCAVTLEVLETLSPQLDNISAQTYGFSRDLQAPVLEMALRGLRVDEQKRREVLKSVNDDLDRIAANLDKIVVDGIGTSIGWRSPKQLGVLLYDILGFTPIRKRNANGAMVPTVNRDALERLATNYFLAEPICNHLLTLRDLDKQRQFLVSEVGPDGRIRTGPNIAGTRTGRLSCSLSDFGGGANLQTVDERLRSIFIPDPGMEFANFDLEQGDSRNVGALCWNLFVESHGEGFAGAYLDACESGDLHSTVSRMVWPEEDPLVVFYRKDTYRQISKKLGHGTVYYGSPKTMARHSKVDTSVIEDFQQRFFGTFPVIGVYDRTDKITDCWHNRVRRQIREASMLITPFGRRRFFYGRSDDDETLRAAIAYEPQSMTAEEINIGMMNLWRKNICQILLQVHDSLLLQYPIERRDEILPQIAATLPVRLPLVRDREFTVPVDAKIGMNWGNSSETNPAGLKKWKR